MINPVSKSQEKSSILNTKNLLILLFFFFVLLVFLNYPFHSKKAMSSNITSVSSQKLTNYKTSSPLNNKQMKPVEINNDPAIDQYLKNIHFNGSALVVKNGQVLINKGYGYSNFSKKIANNSQTVFYTASISKMFVATAIMQLQEQKKLNINDTLDKYIPDFPNGKKITLVELLTHTSGIPQASETNKKISHEELIKKIEKGHLLFQPGTGWYYSDTNYSILAYIVEKVSKTTLENYVQNSIFNVAHMKHSGFGDQYHQERYQAIGYHLNSNNTMDTPALPDMSQLFGSGDVYATPYDMYLFDKALYTGQLVPQSSLKRMFTPHKNNYGFGLFHDPGSYSEHGVLPGWNLLDSFGLHGKSYIVLFSNERNGVKSLGVLNEHIFGLLNKVN